MKNEQIMATANNASAPNEILLFQLAPLYSNETRKGCGLLGKEIDANFQYLNGNDIVDFHVVKSEEEDGRIKNKLIITLRNGYEFPVDIDEELRADTFAYDPVHGIFTVTRYDGTEVKLTGFLVEGRDIHVVNDGTIDGDGTWAKPLTLNPTLKTGLYAPVRQYVDLTDIAGYETLDDFVAENAEKYPKLKGLRFITREKINSFGYLYSLRGAKKAVELAGNGWRIPTLDDWDSMMNYIETMSGCTCDNPHEGMAIAELGCKAGKILKSTRMWLDDEENFGTDEVGFGVLPVGSMLCNQEPSENMPDFLRNAYFWTGTDFQGNGAWIKSFSFTNSTVRQEPDTGVRMYSLRLCKDAEWDGFDNEIIAGQVVPCAGFPYVDEEGMVRSRVWTLINVAIPIPDAMEYRYPDMWDEYSAETEFRSTQPGYFICEHDGHEWKKRQMMDGDSVVIIDSDTLDGTDDDEKEYAQYRVEWDEEIEEYVLVDVLDVFRRELENIVNNLEGRVTLLEEMAHTHDNKEVLDEISQERVEKWDAAEENAIDSAMTNVLELSGTVVSAVDAIGLNENLELDLTAFRYIQVTQDELGAEPVPYEYKENPTKDDPEWIYVIRSGVEIVFYHKVDATQYIGNADNIVNALKNLDTAILNEKNEREAAVESAKTEAIEESKAYTDEKVAEINEDIDDIERAIEDEERQRMRADEKLFVKPKDKSINVLHCTDGTYINVNIPDVYSADTLPNHIGLDRDGLYFDGFFGVIPGVLDLTKIETLIEYQGVSYDNIQSVSEGGVEYYSVDWTARFRVADGAPIASPLTIDVQENLMDTDGEMVLCGFTVSLSSGQTEATAKVTLVSDGGSHAGSVLVSEMVEGTLRFLESDTNKVTVMEYGIAHDYNVKSSFEMANEKIVRYGVKKHSDSQGFTQQDFENASVAEVDADNSINVVFYIPSVAVEGYADMSYDEQENAKLQNSYDFFIMTNKEIKMTIPANIGNDIDRWELRKWTVENVAVSRLAGNTNIYDPNEDSNPGYINIPYEIRFNN